MRAVRLAADESDCPQSLWTDPSVTFKVSLQSLDGRELSLGRINLSEQLDRT
jgi:hypothetical protein